VRRLIFLNQLQHLHRYVSKAVRIEDLEAALELHSLRAQTNLLGKGSTSG
jgi:hypothetical protein